MDYFYYVCGRMYDVLIVGGGPAGLAAGIYAARYAMKAAIFTMLRGGTITESHIVENYPGVIKATGTELMDKFVEHAKHFDVPIIEKQIDKVEKNKVFKVITTDGKEYEGKTIIFCTGTTKRRLDAKGVERLNGKGISYCATCDGFFFKDKRVAVIGGSDSAALTAILMAGIAKEVYIIYRKEKLRAEPIWVKRIEANPKIKIIYKSNVIEAVGEKSLEKVRLDSGKELKIDGLFIEIGNLPNTKLAEAIGVKLDSGLIDVDKSQGTSVKGVYAAGDVTNNSNNFRQVLTAASEGIIAISAINSLLSK